MRSLSDERLVNRVRAGDEAAFEAIYDRHHRGLLSFTRHMLGNQQEAEDAVQHTFIAAYRSLLAGDRDIQVKAWLYAIARNRSLSLLRARREHTPLDDVEPATEGLAAEVERRQDLKDLLADLQRLPEEQRAALVLSEIAAHSHDEIGVILGVPKSKVKALVFQARTSIADSRGARDTPCAVVQEQLATLHGGALRRNQIRRHVDACSPCQAFRAETQRQKAAMAFVLPVVPALGLKSSVLAATTASASGFIGGGGALVGAGVGAAGAGGSSAVFGSGVVASGLAAVAGKGLLTKVVVTAAVAAGASGGGYVVLNGNDATAGGASNAQARGTSGFDVASKAKSRPSGVAGGIGLPEVRDATAGKPTLNRLAGATDTARPTTTTRKRKAKKRQDRTAAGGGATSPSSADAGAQPTQGSTEQTAGDDSTASSPGKFERKQARREAKQQRRAARVQAKQIRQQAKQERRLPATGQAAPAPKTKQPKAKPKFKAKPAPAAPAPAPGPKGDAGKKDAGTEPAAKRKGDD